MKKCTKCGEEKPLSKFHRDKSKRDGLSCVCKACAKVYHMLHRDKHLAYGRAYAKKNVAAIAAQKKAYRLANPEKRKAHDKVDYAKEVGTLIPQPCEICGSTESVEAHHDDYSKPLNVQWLCRSCHRLLHAELRRMECA